MSMFGDLAGSFGLLSALGLGIFALASEWISFLDSSYQASKRQMERWANFDRHGPTGYTDIWEGDSRTSLVKATQINMEEYGHPDIPDNEPFYVILEWPIDVRAGRRAWHGYTRELRRTFKRRSRESSKIYGEMITKAMRARRLHRFGLTAEERERGRLEDENLEKAGIGMWHDRSVMNGRWADMASAIWLGRYAWGLLVFGATLGTLAAVLALAALLQSWP